MKIRYARARDMDLLLEGEQDVHTIEKRPLTNTVKKKKTKEYKQAIKNKQIIVAEENEKPIGFFYFIPDFKLKYIPGKVFWADFIYVKKEFRGKGVSKELWKEIEKIAKRKKYETIFGSIFETNPRSKKFHTKKVRMRPVYTVYRRQI